MAALRLVTGKDEMSALPTEQRRAMQSAWVVDDIEAACLKWVETTGIGPFYIFPHLQLEVSYRGKPSTIDFSVASAQAGDVQIELIQQHCDTPSAYRDQFKRGEQGHHHMAIYVADYDAALAHYTNQGFVAATAGLFGEMRFCYVDTRDAIGCMIEIIQHDPIQDAIFERISEGAKNWDGVTDPIRQGMPE